MEHDSGILPGQEDGRRGSAYLVGLARAPSSTSDTEEHLEELTALADTAGFSEAGRALLSLRHPHPATLVGKGQAEDVGVMARGLGAQVVIVDDDLSPAQVRNLEKIFDLPVVDRAGLIIDIFAARARSREARTQVEIARLEYLLPRLAGRWAHLSRQVGGGPGGTKGEGEKQIELDRRMIRHRIDGLRRELDRVNRGRAVRRQGRRGLPEAAMVGYTNVGKSSLFNALSGGRVFVENRLFATLDPTVRRVAAGRRGEFLLKDTVGFIRKLPHHLVASFRSTFEEAQEADLLLVVVDMAHPAFEEQHQITLRVLEETELGGIPRLVVYNKADLAGPQAAAGLAEREPEAFVISARTGQGLDRLLTGLADRLLGFEMRTELVLPADRGDLLALACRVAAVEQCETHDGEIKLTLRATGRVVEDLRGRISAGEGRS